MEETENPDGDSDITENNTVNRNLVYLLNYLHALTFQQNRLQTIKKRDKSRIKIDPGQTQIWQRPQVTNLLDNIQLKDDGKDLITCLRSFIMNLILSELLKKKQKKKFGNFQLTG